MTFFVYLPRVQKCQKYETEIERTTFPKFSSANCKLSPITTNLTLVSSSCNEVFKEKNHLDVTLLIYTSIPAIWFKTIKSSLQKFMNHIIK